ncbi:MAG: OmpA family protein [Elusimicrobia bacterium]|nr:OmpA family protein [Elusimicrobiota bacterium]MDE2511548.1 OmpA family protein [Elusimicrobiota bacterium]
MRTFLHRLTRPQAEENPLWLVVLCDLMTNLMLFFLVMYSFTLQNPKTRSEWLRAFQASQLIDTQQARADAVVREFKEKEAARALIELLQPLKSAADIDVTERTIRVRLRDQLLFPTSSSGLNARADATLGELASVLRQIPNDVLVEGHTDDVPIVSGPYRTNWELSVARAASVIAVLTKDGVPPARLIAAGYGPYHPLAANDAEGRARNRRVEIVILRGGGGADE